MPGAVGYGDGVGARLRSDERAAGEGYGVLAGGGAVAAAPLMRTPRADSRLAKAWKVLN
jgi:hypothetical protein